MHQIRPFLVFKGTAIIKYGILHLEVITGDDVTGSFLLSKSSVSSRMGCGIFREELSLSENIGVRCCGVSKVA